MKFIREFFGNIPIFQKNIEKELERNNIESINEIKKIEHSRQLFKRFITVSLILLFIIGGTLLFYTNSKNSTSQNKYEVKATKDSNALNNGVRDQNIKGEKPSKLLSMTETERANGALMSFETWYKSFENKSVVFEIENSELNEAVDSIKQEDLRIRLIDKLGEKMTSYTTNSYMSITNKSLMVNPLTIENEKGLTILNDTTQPEKLLYTWYLDTDKATKNTRIVMRNDFSYEYVNWRKESKNVEQLKNVFTDIDFTNDLSYEVIGVSLKNKSKIIPSPSVVAILMKYDDKTEKWLMTERLGGI